MREITDPNLIAELEGANTPSMPNEVTDPQLLQELEMESSLPKRFQERPEVRPNAIPSNDLLVGIGARTNDLLGNLAGFGGTVTNGFADMVDDMVGRTRLEAAKLFLGEEALNEMSRAAPQMITAGPTGLDPIRMLGDELTELDRKSEDVSTMVNYQPATPLTLDEFLADPLSMNTAKYIFEQGAVSIPDMAAVLTGPGIIPYIGSRAQEIAETRVQNEQDGPSAPTDARPDLEQLATATPFAAASALLERIGAKTVVPGPELASAPIKEAAKQAGKKLIENAPARVGKAVVTEGATEAAQEGIEYTGETIDTNKPMSASEIGERAAMAALAGGGFGGAVRTTEEVVHSATKAAQKKKDAKAIEAPPAQIEDNTDEGDGLTSLNLTQDEDGKIKAETVPVQKEPVPAKGVETINAIPAEPVQTTKPAVQTPVTQETKTKKVVTPRGDQEVEVRSEIMNADDLVTSDNKAFPQTLQPRDRSRATSGTQIARIAANLDPEQLGDSRTTDTGAPIIGDDNVVESGNGRVMSIRQAYETNPEGAERYRESLRKQGYNIDGIERPVLVRRRVTPLDEPSRVKFTVSSNERTGADLSTTERAKADASAITSDDMESFAGGDVSSASNRTFVKRIMAKIVSPNDQARMIAPDGSLSQDGVRRFRAAVLSKAYDDTDMVQRLMEDQDNNIKGIGSALLSRAGNWAKMVNDIKSGRNPSDLDITKNLIEAVKIVARARESGDKIGDVIKQGGLFDGDIDPVTEKLVRAMYNQDLTRAVSQQKIEEVLDYYTDQVGRTPGGKGLDLWIENVTAAKILDNAINSRDGVNPNQRGFALDEGQATQKPARKRDRSADKFEDTLDFGEEAELDEADDTGGDTVPPKRPASQKPDPASNQRSFIEQAFTNRPSWYRKIFRDAGHDPAKAVNYPPERQLKIMRKALFDKYGIEVAVDPKMPVRKALDQISDMYMNMSSMAYVLGLPAKAMALQSKARNSRLRLLLKAKAPFLGVFYPTENVIGLPGRSNSFAHEWGHALDYHVLKEIEDDTAYAGMSGKIRNAGADYTPGTVSEAWVNLMQKIFFEEDVLATEIVRLETHLEATKSEKQKEALSKAIENIKTGKTQIRTGRTTFYKNAAAMANPGYWAKPTEFLARSFEAYIASKITNAGGDTAAISKTDDGYMSSAESRFAQTFPRNEDRDQIFHAYDQLFDRMREAHILDKGLGDPVTQIEKDLDMVNPANWDRAAISINDKKGLAGLVQRTIERTKEEFNENVRVKAKPKDARSIARRLQTMYSLTLQSMQTFARMQENRYKNSRSLRHLNDMYFKRSGDSSTVKETYREEVEGLTGRYRNRINNIFNNYKLRRLNKDQMDQLYDVMTSKEGDKFDAPENIIQAGAQLRAIMDELWQHGDNAGLKIGYVKNQAYLQRLVDMAKILPDQKGFQDAAFEAYQIQFDHDVGTDGDVKLKEFVEMIAYANAKSREFGRGAPFATKGPNKDQRVVNLKKMIAEMRAEEDPDKAEALEQKIQDFLSSSGLLSDVRETASDLAAESWLNNLLGGGVATLHSNPGRSSFMKGRSFTPEASAKMREFYVTDPHELISQYSEEMISEAAFERRRARTEEMMKNLASEGLDKQDILHIQNILQTLTGKKQSSGIMGDFQAALSYLHMFGTIVLLGRSMIASLSEPITFAVRTGRTQDAFRAMIATIGDTIKTSDRETRADIAAFLGIVTEDMVAAGLDNRFGGSFQGDSKTVQMLTSRFFRRSGLTGLTNAQRRAGIAVSNAYLKWLSKKILAGGKTKQRYINELAEAGIPANQAVEFAKWLTDIKGYPDLDSMRDTPFGEMYGLATRRINYESVQNPTMEQRPLMAANPIGRLVLSVTSFMYGFWENIVKGTAKRVYRVGKEEGFVAGTEVLAMRYLGPLAMLWAAQAIISAARTALLNPDRWEEWEEEGTVADNAMLAGLSAMGLAGPTGDAFLNAAVGVRYQRDLSNIFAGAYTGFYLDQIQRFISPLVSKNSEKSNTGEYNMSKAFYQGAVAPMIAGGLNWLPGGGVIGAAYGMANMYLTSGAAAEHFAEMMVGEKGAKTDGNFQRGAEE